VDTGLDALNGSLKLDAKILGLKILADPIVTLVTATVQTVLNTLQLTNVVSGLLNALGVSVGNADIQVVSVSPVDRNLRTVKTEGETLSLRAFLFQR